MEISLEPHSKPKLLTKDLKDTLAGLGSKIYHNLPIPMLYMNIKEIKK